MAKTKYDLHHVCCPQPVFLIDGQGSPPNEMKPGHPKWMTGPQNLADLDETYAGLLEIEQLITKQIKRIQNILNT